MGSDDIVILKPLSLICSSIWIVNIWCFFNRTKVFKARIPLSWVKIIKKNGYEVSLDKGEIFVYSLLGKDQFECLVSDGKHFKPGSEIVIDEKSAFWV